MTLAIRIRPVGSAKLCIVAVTTPRFPGEVLAWHSSDKPGLASSPRSPARPPGVVPETVTRTDRRCFAGFSSGECEVRGGDR
jgi:hypothetical protein